MFCVKYHEKILSFTRYRDVYPMGSKIPHAGPKEKARHIYFLFLEYHTNSKNIFAKFHEEKLKSSQVIEKTTQNGPQKFWKWSMERNIPPKNKRKTPKCSHAKMQILSIFLVQWLYKICTFVQNFTRKNWTVLKK